MDLKGLPKIELHLHLDCSLSYSVVRKLDPGKSELAYRESFIGPVKCIDLADFLTRAVNGIRLMQTQEALELVTWDLLEQLQADNVIYAEIRFAPLLHTERGLRPEEVVDIVSRAMYAGIACTGVQAGLILCTLRHFSEVQSLETARLAEQFLGSGVVGFDIAGNEAGFPIDAHITAFQYARQKGIPCTAHAGEARGPVSVWETLEHFQPQRIGHGVRSAEDEELMKQLKEKNIHLEVCPTSNIQTNIYNSLLDHPVDRIYQEKLSFSINTDARTISDATLASEYRKLMDNFNWGRTQFLYTNLEAVEHAFISPEKKWGLRKIILEAWE